MTFAEYMRRHKSKRFSSYIDIKKISFKRKMFAKQYEEIDFNERIGRKGYHDLFTYAIYKDCPFDGDCITIWRKD